MERPFRSEESYAAEHKTRGMLEDFLAQRGFSNIRDQRTLHGKTESQIIYARDELGNPLAMSVRLCWHRDKKQGEVNKKSAAQLQARLTKPDWEDSIKAKMDGAKARGATHLLIVQREGDEITRAAEIPISAVVPIWKKQRDISKALIAAGRLGKRRKKNHAENGGSPTIWLLDSQAPTVADALWTHSGVRDLARLQPTTATPSDYRADDSVDDLPGLDYDNIGADGVERVERLTSGVPRDPRGRAAVRLRSGGKCERGGCGASRNYPGFLDVHHILGAANSDRVWNCVALCPNCHREAHFALDRVRINEALLEFANQFQQARAQ